MDNLKTGQNIQISSTTLVNTENGIIRADRVRPKTFLKAADGSRQKIKNNSELSNIQAYKLTLKNGFNITLGENSMLRTINGWKSVHELTSNDYVLHQRLGSLGKEGEKEIQWESVFNTNAIPLEIPQKMSKEFAKWLGMLCSRGRYVEQNGFVGITTKDEQVGKIFDELTQKVFEVSTETMQDSREGRGVFHYIISKNLVRFLRFFIGPTLMTRRPPQQVIEGSLPEQLAFVEGLTLDGYVEQNSLVVYGGIAKRLAEFSAIVLRTAGYMVYEQQKTTGEKRTPAYYTKITGYTNESFLISPIEKYKNEGIKKGKFLVKVPDSLFEKKIPSNHESYSAVRNIKQRSAPVCYNQTLDSLELEYPKEFYFIKVKSVVLEKKETPIQEMETFTSTGIVVSGLIIGSKE